MNQNNNPKEQLLEALHLMGSIPGLGTHGNLSVKFGNMVYIKPSGMEYLKIKKKDICEIALGPSGNILKQFGDRNPSVDLKHHLSLYNMHPWLVSICHTHSTYCTGFALAGESLECYSSEQADIFGGMVRCFPFQDLDFWGARMHLMAGEKAALLESHGALTFGDSPVEAVKNAINLENIAQKNFIAFMLDKNTMPLPNIEIDKQRTRYINYYGQDIKKSLIPKNVASKKTSKKQ